MRGGQLVISFCICFLFLLFKACARARARFRSKREERRGVVCGVSRDDVQNIVEFY